MKTRNEKLDPPASLYHSTGQLDPPESKPHVAKASDSSNSVGSTASVSRSTASESCSDRDGESLNTNGSGCYGHRRRKSGGVPDGFGNNDGKGGISDFDDPVMATMTINADGKQHMKNRPSGDWCQRHRLVIIGIAFGILIVGAAVALGAAVANNGSGRNEAAANSGNIAVEGSFADADVGGSDDPGPTMDENNYGGNAKGGQGAASGESEGEGKGSASDTSDLSSPKKPTKAPKHKPAKAPKHKPPLTPSAKPTLKPANAITSSPTASPSISLAPTKCGTDRTCNTERDCDCPDGRYKCCGKNGYTLCLRSQLGWCVRIPPDYTDDYFASTNWRQRRLGLRKKRMKGEEMDQEGEWHLDPLSE